ncbi:unnamed protein product [Blepharisma stoltei]|uniref:Ribosomal protein L32 n=1 Tax=Blepharisma stoltei TaxID=1481888 RepID=A0AAU9IXA7_9CILI|nr:unnamed protein product [Blepharisma stoltei]
MSEIWSIKLLIKSRKLNQILAEKLSVKLYMRVLYYFFLQLKFLALRNKKPINFPNKNSLFRFCNFL